MAFWRWNQEAGRYIVTREGAAALNRPAGSFVSVNTLSQNRELFLDSQKDKAQDLIGNLLDESISITDWVMAMRQEVKIAHLAQYMLAKGGKSQMTQADYGRVGQVLREQYQFLNGFAEDILDGNLSEAQMRARANLYFNSSNSSFHRGRAASFGLDLPQYPADGQTRCRANCKCRWDISEDDEQWLAYWRLSPAEHCPDCLNNSAQWGPLIVRKI